MGVKSSEMGAKINFYPKGLHMSEICCIFARRTRAERKNRISKIIISWQRILNQN